MIMVMVLLFFLAGLWMADGVALLFAPVRMIHSLRQSLTMAPGLLKWGGVAALLGVFLLYGSQSISYQPLWILVGISMIAKGIFLYAGSDLWRLRIVKWCLEREAIDYRIWGLCLCTLSVLLLDALGWGKSF